MIGFARRQLSEGVGQAGRPRIGGVCVSARLARQSGPVKEACMKRMFWIFLITAAAFVFATSPVVKRWTGGYLSPLTAPSQRPPDLLETSKPVASHFKCDGRQYCSQMTSCAEAK